MSKLYELSWRTNINTYTFRGKHIILYDDHRTLLNILFEAKKLGEFAETPNLIYFDLHDDACTLLPKSQLLERMGVKDLSEAGYFGLLVPPFSVQMVPLTFLSLGLLKDHLQS